MFRKLFEHSFLKEYSYVEQKKKKKVFSFLLIRAVIIGKLIFKDNLKIELIHNKSVEIFSFIKCENV